jgi:hypothetical protein
LKRKTRFVEIGLQRRTGKPRHQASPEAALMQPHEGLDFR